MPKSSAKVIIGDKIAFRVRKGNNHLLVITGAYKKCGKSGVTGLYNHFDVTR